MPERETLERAKEDAREGKSPSTQAGEFVREEIHHIREGKHGARSPQQAIAIGLSKTRRARVKLSPPKGPASTRKKAQQGAGWEGRQRLGAQNISDTLACRGGHPRARISQCSQPRGALSSRERIGRERGEQSRRKAAAKASRTRKAA